MYFIVGGWFFDHPEGSVLEMAKVVPSKARVIHKKFNLMDKKVKEPLLSASREVPACGAGKTTPGERLAKQVYSLHQ